MRNPLEDPRERAMNCVGSPGTDPRHCSKLGRRRLSDRTNAAKSRDEGSRGRERDEGDRAQHRNLDPVPGACRPAIRRTDPDPLSWGSGQRDRPDPQRCVVRARRSDYRYPTITERDESASDAALRQRSCVEILALHDDDRVLGRGTKPVQLLPESARGDGGVEVANRLPLDLRLCTDHVITCREGCKFDPDPELLEGRRNSARDLTMIRDHHEWKTFVHGSQHACCPRPFLVAVRSTATTDTV